MREKELNNLKYRQLQKLAKEHDIKANQSNSHLIKALLEAFEKNEASNKDHALEIAETELHKQEASVRKIKEDQQALIQQLEEIEEKLEAAELEVESAKFKVEVIKRKNHIEEIFWRFPHLGTQIFEKLDHSSLVKCREIGTWWKKFVDNDKTFWIKQIQEHISMPNPSVTKTLQKENYDYLQELADASKESFDSALRGCKNKKKPNTFELLYSLLLKSRLIACHDSYDGNDNKPLNLIKLIIDNVENKNPWLENVGVSALSQAARLGNMEAYKLISKELDEKNPIDIYGYTPLHYAVRYENYNICQFITKNSQNLESLDQMGYTPLQLAESGGFKEISELLKSCIEEQSFSSKSKKRRLK